nr:unnamed protein product [Spirometra erinaceieuropaei]
MNLDPADLQPTDKAIENAKALLSSVKCGPKENLYEQMVSLLKHLLKFKSECGPSNMDHFTNLVQFSHIEQKDRVKEFKEKADEVFFAEIFQTIYNEEPDLIHLNHILNNAETGFSTDESILLSMHFQKLLNKYPSEHIRFWGKIFGFKRSYYIAEAQDFQAWPVGDENSDVLQTSKTKSRNELIDMLDFDENGFPIEGPPKPLWKPPPTVPVEAPGQGANKHAYFVLSEFGSDWELLPAVEPEQIKCARKIRLFFTGDLDATIISYPPFPGKERHLLRAQIARITAATLISPMNFYRFDEEEEESDDEEVHHEHFMENEEYEPLTVAELADPSVTNWVHHAPYLLPQGRTKWLVQDVTVPATVRAGHLREWARWHT